MFVFTGSAIGSTSISGSEMPETRLAVRRGETARSAAILLLLANLDFMLQFSRLDFGYLGRRRRRFELSSWSLKDLENNDTAQQRDHTPHE